MSIPCKAFEKHKQGLGEVKCYVATVRASAGAGSQGGVAYVGIAYVWPMGSTEEALTSAPATA